MLQPPPFVSRREFMAAAAAAALATRLRATAGGVRLGVCANLKNLDAVAAAGFDYIEPSAADIAALDAAGFAAVKQQVLASKLRCESFNSFIRRPDLNVVGEEVHDAALVDYMETTLERCRQLGAQVVVWGSAGSRNVPAGFPRERAWRQIADFLQEAGEIAATKNLVVAIEPLRHQESNIFNTGAEAFKMVREVGHPNVKMIIDYYHLHTEHEAPKILWEARKAIVHFHFANPAGRVWPKLPAEDPEYAAFFAQLKRLHFHGGLSIEGRGTVQADGAAALRFFHEELGA